MNEQLTIYNAAVGKFKLVTDNVQRFSIAPRGKDRPRGFAKFVNVLFLNPVPHGGIQNPVKGADFDRGAGHLDVYFSTLARLMAREILIASLRFGDLAPGRPDGIASPRAYTFPATAPAIVATFASRRVTPYCHSEPPLRAKYCATRKARFLSCH